MECLTCKNIKHDNLVRCLLYIMVYMIEKKPLPVTALKAAKTVYPQLEYLDGRPLDPDFFASNSCGNC